MVDESVLLQAAQDPVGLGPVRFACSAIVGYAGNCGNISSGVGPFAVDEGLVMNWVATIGAKTGSLLPTGRAVDELALENGRESHVTLCDAGNPAWPGSTWRTPARAATVNSAKWSRTSPPPSRPERP